MCYHVRLMAFLASVLSLFRASTFSSGLCILHASWTLVWPEWRVHAQFPSWCWKSLPCQPCQFPYSCKGWRTSSTQRSKTSWGQELKGTRLKAYPLEHPFNNNSNNNKKSVVVAAWLSENLPSTHSLCLNNIWLTIMLKNDIHNDQFNNTFLELVAKLSFCKLQRRQHQDCIKACPQGFSLANFNNKLRWWGWRSDWLITSIAIGDITLISLGQWPLEIWGWHFFTS